MFGPPLPPPWERSVTQRSCPRRPTAAPLALRSRGEAELKWKLECAAAHGKAAAIAERHLSDAEGSYAKLMYEQDKLERLVHLLDNPNVERVLKVQYEDLAWRREMTLWHSPRSRAGAKFVVNRPAAAASGSTRARPPRRRSCLLRLVTRLSHACVPAQRVRFVRRGADCLFLASRFVCVCV